MKHNQLIRVISRNKWLVLLPLCVVGLVAVVVQQPGTESVSVQANHVVDFVKGQYSDAETLVAEETKNFFIGIINTIYIAGNTRWYQIIKTTHLFGHILQFSPIEVFIFIQRILVH